MHYKIERLCLQRTAGDQTRSDYIHTYPEDMHVIPLVLLTINGVVDVRNNV